MALSKKAQEVAERLLENLLARVKGISAFALSSTALSYDPTDGGAYFRLGSGMSLFAGGFYKIMGYPFTPATDALGLPQNVYTPCVIKLCIEANPTGGGGAEVNNPGQMLIMLGEAIKFNCRFELYVVANGVAPSLAGMIPANLQYVFDDLYRPSQLTT
jgi:hypothetical protein